MAVMIAKVYARGHNRTESTRYHGMLVYKGESLDIQEEPWLGWIITTTRQTAEGGEYVVLENYEDGIITTTWDQDLGREMIDVGQATDAGDRIHGMIQRLTSPPHNEEQPRFSKQSARDPYRH